MTRSMMKHEKPAVVFRFCGPIDTRRRVRVARFTRICTAFSTGDTPLASSTMIQRT